MDSIQVSDDETLYFRIVIFTFDFWSLSLSLSHSSISIFISFESHISPRNFVFVSIARRTK